eukprot:1570095-Pleurochrysis_carterae.AAC.2
MRRSTVPVMACHAGQAIFQMSRVRPNTSCNHKPVDFILMADGTAPACLLYTSDAADDTPC